MLKINGKEIDAAGKTVLLYLSDAGFEPDKVAVERNGCIVPKTQYGETILANGDAVEIVSFVGGG